METVIKKLYEAMFLVNSEQAADWDQINKTIENILKRSEAEIVSIRKWDERKLAYKIKKQSHGIYILCYFKADGEKIKDIERDVRLSERIMRVLILNTDAMSQEDIEKGLAPQKDTSSVQPEKQEQRDAPQATHVAEIEQENTQEQEIVELANEEGPQEDNSDDLH